MKEILPTEKEMVLLYFHALLKVIILDLFFKFVKLHKWYRIVQSITYSHITYIYNIFDPKGLKFLTRLGLGLSHLNEHRFRHNF